MAKQKLDELSEAMNLFQDFEKASEPTEKIRKFGAGVDLLNVYVENHPALFVPVKAKVE